MNSLYSDDDSSDDEVVVFKTSDKRQELRREIIEKNLVFIYISIYQYIFI